MEYERASRREVTLGAGVFVVSLGLLLVRFLVPRPIGVTDNGDGWRLLGPLGAYDMGAPTTDDFVRFTYHPAPAAEEDYVASQVWFARVAQWVGRLVGDESALNVLIVGLLGTVLAAAAVTVITLGLPLPIRHRLPAAGLILLVVADSAFFGYFASVLTEGPAFLGILLTVGGLLLMNRDGAWRYLGAGVTVSGGLIGINAKAQTVMILPLVLVALLFVMRPGPTSLSRWALPLTVATILTGATATLQVTASPADTREINSYNTIFNSIVDGAHDTTGDLAALGLPRSFARYVGTYHWWSTSAVHDPLYPNYRDRISRRNVAAYYLRNPGRTSQILNRAATDLMTARPDYQGNFGRDAAMPPRTKEFRVPVLSGLLRMAAPLGLFLLLPLWLAIGWAGVRAWRRGRREIGVVLFLVLSIGLGQFVVAALGEGIENVKHQVIALFCTLLAGMLAIVSLLPGAAARPPVGTLRPDEICRDRAPAGRIGGRVQLPTGR